MVGQFGKLSYIIGRAALPPLRADLALSYAQVGLLLGLPQAINAAVEPGLMLLANNLALIPILERFAGRKVVRASAAVCILLYAAWLVAPWPAVKVILVLSIALAEMGWYAVTDGEIYAAGNGRSGTVNAIGSVGGLLGGLLIWLVGWLADTLGLQAAMWLLILGPVSLVLLVPSPEPKSRV